MFKSKHKAKPNSYLTKKFLAALLALSNLLLVGFSGVLLGTDKVFAASRQKLTAPQVNAATKSFVYVIANPNGPNAVLAYSRNTDTGALSFIGSYPTGGRGTGGLIDSQSPLVVNATGSLLYAVNPASHDISIMAINQDGSLTLIGSPAPSGGRVPASLALTRRFLCVAHQGDGSQPPNYTIFDIGGGVLLTKLQTMEQGFGSFPTQVLFNRRGNVLIGIRLGARQLDSYILTRERSAIINRGWHRYRLGSYRFQRADQFNQQNGPFAATFNPADETQLFVANGLRLK